MTPRADSWVPALSRLFPAARAPRRFLSDLERQLLAFSAWRRAAAWLPELLSQRPQLLDAPLFGTTLAAAVQGEDVRAETPSPRTAAVTPPMPAAPERPRRRSNKHNPLGQQPMPAAPMGAEHPGRRSQAFAPPQATSKERAPLPGQPGTRVERSLLTALAGSIPAPRKTTQLPARLARPRPTAAGERHLPVGAESGRLVQQLAHRLRDQTLAAGIGGAASRVGPTGIAPPVESPPNLAAQWALPLLGPKVSQGFLDAILQAFRPDATEPSPRQGRPAAANPAPNSGLGSKGQGAQGGQPPVVKGARSGAGPHALSADWRPPREAAPWFSALQPGAPPADGSKIPAKLRPLGAPEPESGGQRTPFPSGQTDKVPAPNPAPGQTTGSGMTPGGEFFAALRQHRTPLEIQFDRSPSAIPGAAADDLEELAAKLQRILQEQARRHGIDV